MKDKLTNDKANIPLDMHWKVLTCISPIFLNIILGGTFKAVNVKEIHLLFSVTFHKNKGFDAKTENFI